MNVSFKSICLVILSSFFITIINAQVDSVFVKKNEKGFLRLNQAGAEHLSKLALGCMQKEYPNKLNQVLKDGTGLQSPKELHPAFYGCFDWHSSVHGHWMLVKLLKQFPEMEGADEIRKKLGENLSEENILAEAAYFKTSSKAWERMYGWAWLLKLCEEIHTWDDVDAENWIDNLQPLADAIVNRYMVFLPTQNYPVRTGVHPNTAFGLAFAWDYANTVGHIELKTLIEERANEYYFSDADCPADWEPSGEDFLSGCLEEANLMRRILEKPVFEKWFAEFIPSDKLEVLMTPADVSDRTDPKIVHLDGLNLSRAWCLYGILPAINNPAKRSVLTHAAQIHLEATIPHVATPHYEGSHWLGSFAVFALGVSEE